MVAHIALFRVGLLLSTGLLLVLPVSILLLLIQCGGGSPKNGKKGGGGNDKKEEKKKGKVKDKKSKPKREVAKVEDVAGAGGGGGAKKKKHKNKKDTPPAAPAPAIGGGGGGGAPKPTGPRMIEDGKHEGMADQQAYQTLGNLDRDIFVQGQGGSPGAPPAPPPPSPAAAHQMPSSIRAAPQSMNDPHGAGQVSASDGPIREGLGQGQDYQTWNNLDQNVFDNGQQQPPAPAPSAPAPRPPAANEGEGNESMADGPIREGLGQGQDYQTWNNLDQNVFVQ